MRKITANPNAPPPPKTVTKAALEAEMKARDELRKEFLAMQERIKATEIVIPFVFYDGTNIPAGRVKVKKGDHIWLFLDRCRKVGAELGVAGAQKSGRAKRDHRREWARVGVDDLMLVRGDIIIPHVSLLPSSGICTCALIPKTYTDLPCSTMSFIISLRTKSLVLARLVGFYSTSRPTYLSCKIKV